MCQTVCHEVELHRVRGDFRYCPGCRRYTVVWWLVCLECWQCEDCGDVSSPAATYAPN